ncbi:AAA family ATPase [Halobacteria archaeon AArc-dxtr1]|nr:AAA family ATPase [Halobacteria archaeon AArc-dxtr1]
MDRYDELFDETAPEGGIFREKGALDPLAAPTEVIAREAQERELATVLNGVEEGYLPPTVSVYGPPGTGKTLTTRRLCEAFAARHDAVAVEYVNLKECRSIFSAANEICLEVSGAKVGSYAGLDGAFEAIWEALESYPEWTILILDEIDQIRQDTNYEPSEFLYRLLRGEGKLKREIALSAWLVSNELLEVKLRVDSRVESAMSDEDVFFSPYGVDELTAICEPRVERAFHEGVVPAAVFETGVREAARRWGDARKALQLFRQAGETARERGLEQVTQACLEENVEATEREATIEKLLALPENHFFVLTAITGQNRDGEIKQPVTTAEVRELLQADVYPTELSGRAIRTVVSDLETMGLLETWIESRGRDGRVKQLQTTCDPQWVRAAIELHAERTAADEDADI